MIYKLKLLSENKTFENEFAYHLSKLAEDVAQQTKLQGRDSSGYCFGLRFYTYHTRMSEDMEHSIWLKSTRLLL